MKKPKEQNPMSAVAKELGRRGGAKTLELHGTEYFRKMRHKAIAEKKKAEKPLESKE